MSEHTHQHVDVTATSRQRLWWAVVINLCLTLAQIIGGILSGSLSLIADALHNFSDAASLGIALIAVRIGALPADEFKTFGYKRAEVIAALINVTTLIIVGLYLIYEAVWRLAEPEPIHGWTVILVATIALIIDLVTSLLTYSMSKHSINIRAAFLHNISDALSSVGVILAGLLIIWFGWFWTDTVLTILIAGYVLWQAFTLFPKAVHILMEGTPEHLSIQQVIHVMETIPDVVSVHHVHVWQLDEHRNALEAHVVLDTADPNRMHQAKLRMKQALKSEFNIDHTTLELEFPGLDCKDQATPSNTD